MGVTVPLGGNGCHCGALRQAGGGGPSAVVRRGLVRRGGVVREILVARRRADGRCEARSPPRADVSAGEVGRGVVEEESMPPSLEGEGRERRGAGSGEVVGEVGGSGGNCFSSGEGPAGKVGSAVRDSGARRRARERGRREERREGEADACRRRGEIVNPDFSREIPDFSQNFYFWFEL